MGRVRFFRQRVQTEASSVMAKSLSEYLASEIRARREVSPEEAALIASDCMEYLERCLGLRKLGEIEFPAVLAEGAHFRRKREDQEERLVRLTVISDDDANVLSDHGAQVMQISRMARVIEEAYYQGCLLDGQRLCVLFPLTAKAIRARLATLIDQGATLPLAGMSKETRAKFRGLRAVLAVERHLNGESPRAIQRSLAIGSNQWRRWWNGFRRVVTLETSSVPEIARATGEPEPVVSGWLEMWKSLKRDGRQDDVLKPEVVWEWEAKDLFSSPAGFRRLLVERHGYSAASAEEFTEFLREVAIEYGQARRSSGQIVYIACGSDEAPGKSLEQTRLQAVVLDYLTPDDWVTMDRDSPAALKWKRIERFATQAYSQGASLGIHDIAYLVGASVDAVRDSMASHKNIVLPTRGLIADMGPTLSHAEKIIRLYMDGYTETEIVRRTGHSYDSVERYILDFSRVVYLREFGMPVPALRKAVALSRRVVEKYLKLYEEFKGPGYEFRLAQIRRFAQAHPPKRRHKRRGVREDEYG
ncbi:MAG: DUF1670 domain-containing protein [Firmicutes bacterium]|nr:DUF1670 domain-containing protein [Bacillota bacterium]